MREQLAQDIIDGLPKERTLFYYYKDRYAVMLLDHLVEHEQSIAEIKNSKFGKLLQRPILADLIKTKGDGKLSKEDLEFCWPHNPLCYRLTAGIWGADRPRHAQSYYQTSRKGVNLVLQLNFSRKHDSEYERLIDQTDTQPFNYDDHPTARAGFNTLAWARIDLDFESGEALIEEVQSDWVRYVKAGRNRLSNALAKGERTVEFFGVTLSFNTFYKYLGIVVAEHLKLWDEALLSAVIWFLQNELNIKNIYMHDFETGNRLKSIASRVPPQSLYTDLPRKFCFTKVADAPSFLAIKPSRAFKSISRAGTLRFWRLDPTSE